MRIWDINPGQLNDKSLLGEHRELHGIVSILVNNKSGYANTAKRRVGVAVSFEGFNQKI